MRNINIALLFLENLHRVDFKDKKQWVKPVTPQINRPNNYYRRLLHRESAKMNTLFGGVNMSALPNVARAWESETVHKLHQVLYG